MWEFLFTHVLACCCTFRMHACRHRGRCSVAAVAPASPFVMGILHACVRRVSAPCPASEIDQASETASVVGGPFGGSTGNKANSGGRFVPKWAFGTLQIGLLAELGVVARMFVACV